MSSTASTNKSSCAGAAEAVSSTPSKPQPRIALTPGEPAGIGPDLVLMMDPSYRSHVTVIGDPRMLEERAAHLGLDVNITTAQGSPRLSGAQQLQVVPVAVRETVRPGELAPGNAAYVLETLERAARGCLTGEFAALVTGPVHKGVINDAGVKFLGHTELFAKLSGVELPVMMLSAPGLRVALVTTHLPLRAVSEAINAQRLEQTIRILDADLRTKFGIARPAIVVCGLNPHAGEGGHLGTEELTVIEPTLARLRREGMDLKGPIPADTAFTPARLEGVDAVLAMYHDQGLPVLKHVGFGEAVNITLGLPFIRTSVDHGTALDLAGSGQIDVGSLNAAVAAALKMMDTRADTHHTTAS